MESKPNLKPKSDGPQIQLSVSQEYPKDWAETNIKPMISWISKESGLTQKEVVRRAQRKRRALGPVTLWFSLSLVAREQGLEMSAIMELIENLIRSIGCSDLCSRRTGRTISDRISEKATAIELTTPKSLITGIGDSISTRNPQIVVPADITRAVPVVAYISLMESQTPIPEALFFSNLLQTCIE